MAAETVAERLTTLIEEGVKQYEAAQNNGGWPGSVPFRGAGHFPRECALSDSFADSLSGFLTTDVLARYKATLSGQGESGITHAEYLTGGKVTNAYAGSPAMYREIAVGIHPRIYAAYIAIAVNYLAEVLELMPKYAEDSGQGKRRDPITINARNIGAIGEVNNSHVSVADTVNSIGATVQAVADRGQTDTADAIRALAEAIERDPGLAEDLRAQLLDNVADVADAAAAPDGPRALSRGRAAMAAITSAAGASSQLAQAVSTWQGVLGQLF